MSGISPVTRFGFLELNPPLFFEGDQIAFSTPLTSYAHPGVGMSFPGWTLRFAHPCLPGWIRRGGFVVHGRNRNRRGGLFHPFGYRSDLYEFGRSPSPASRNPRASLGWLAAMRGN